ncbi:MAG: CHRD domain-containing protein [Gammaproteobacteria bacterium]
MPSVLLAVMLSLPAIANAAMWNFAGAINLSQEMATHDVSVPAIYFGGGLVSASLDDESGSFLVNAFATGLTGDPTGAHIHAGAPGVAGPIVLDLGAPGINTPGIIGYSLATTLSADQIDALTGGGALTTGAATDWYVNIHTATNPDGEIRGQLMVAQAPSAVPLPAGVWLLGSALVGMGWMRRSRR